MDYLMCGAVFTYLVEQHAQKAGWSEGSAATKAGQENDRRQSTAPCPALSMSETIKLHQKMQPPKKKWQLLDCSIM